MAGALKTLHLYLTRQVLMTLGMTISVFTFVLLLGNTLKEILVLLVNRQATFGVVAEAILLLVPWVLAFALPVGMLTASLLVFGRFSADQELTAVRSSGVSLVALAAPILALSLVLCGVSAVINLEVAPRCRVAYKALLDGLLGQLAGAALPEGRFVKDFAPYTIYVGRNDGHDLRDICVYLFDNEQKPVRILNAPRGELLTSNNVPYLTLFDGDDSDRDGTNGWRAAKFGSYDVKLDFGKAPGGAKSKPGISDMTFRELQTELRETEEFLGKVELADLEREQLLEKMKVLRERPRDLTTPIRVQIHRQVAFSFSCFGFTLVGIPLGIRAHRRETNIGIALAIGLAALYYSFVILGQALSGHGEWAPYLIVWIPNFIFQTVGAVLLWRVNRGI